MKTRTGHIIQLYRTRLSVLLELVNVVCHFTDHFAWRNAVQRRPVYQSAVSRGSHVLVKCIAVYVGLLITMLTEAFRNGFFGFTNTRHI